MSDIEPSGNLIRLTWRDGETTEFVGQIITEFHRDNRVIFLCAPHKAASIMSRIRMRMSRARNDLEAKGIPRHHFGMREDRFPYTNSKGTRLTAIVLRKFKTNRHKIKETVEGIIHADQHGGLAKGQNQSKPIEREQYEW